MSVSVRTLFIGGALTILSLPLAWAQGPVAVPPSPQSIEGGPANRVMIATGSGTGFSCPFCDLRGAQLAGRDLSNANLQGANLTGADLSGANLSGAILSRTDLSNANLSKANLGPSGKGPADMAAANLSGANLSGANIDGTDLQYTDLSHTDLSKVDLRRAKRGPAKMSLEGDVTCGNADLSEVKNRVYVSTQGSDDPPKCGATPATACATIDKAITQCQGLVSCGVLTMYGEYQLKKTVALTQGVNVYGGCVTSQVRSSNVLQSLLIAPVGGTPAMSASGIGSTATLLQGFRLEGAAAPSNSGQASTTLVVDTSPKLSVLDATILAGAGGSGQTGSAGGNGAGGVNGSGASAGTQSQCPAANGGNGSVKMDVSVDVGVFKFSCNPSCSNNACWGYGAAQGAGGGKWGDQNCAECPSSRGSTGNGGGNGQDASCGGKGYVSGNLVGSFAGTAWQGGTGGGGTGGYIGAGGGGGGAGGYKAGACFWVKTEDPGNQGGGGGSGGCSGAGGGGGIQGGATFAVAVFNSAFNISNSTLVGGRSGDGGLGGTGGKGGNRSTGADGLTNYGGGYGGKGGNGGAGGAGGGGAGGNSGPSIVVALVRNSQVIGNNNDYYTGSSGNVGGKGTGGQPVVSGVCVGPDGDQGQTGVVGQTYSYPN